MPPATGQRAYFGVPEWLLSYRKDWLRPDVIAGLTAAAVIPKSMAYTSVAGLPLQVGLYTAFLPMIIYAFLCTSRVLSVSTTTTIAILTATQLEAVVANGSAESLARAAASLTVLVGTMLVVACFLRLGFVANFISQPHLIGFKAGIGVVIILDQVPKLLGIHITKGTFLQHLLYNPKRSGNKTDHIGRRIISIDLSAVFDLEYTALKMLADAEKKHRKRGIRLWLVGMNPEVLTLIQKSSLSAWSTLVGAIHLVFLTTRRSACLVIQRRSWAGFTD